MTKKLLTVAAIALSFALPTAATFANDAASSATPAADTAAPAKKKMRHHKRKAATGTEAPAK